MIGIFKLSMVLLTLVVFWGSGSAVASESGEAVFVRPLQIEADTANLRSSVFELVKAAVTNESDFSLESEAQNASLQLDPKLLKLGNSYILSIDKIKGSRVVFTAKMKAASAEDLDTVISRVVHAVLQGRKAEGSAQVDDVTEDETTRGRRRILVLRQWKFAFGPGWGSNTNTSKSGLAGSLGYAWGLDSQWEVDSSLSLSGISKEGESGAYFSEMMVGASYFFNKEKHAPYVKGKFGYALAGASGSDSLLTNDDKANGWALGGGVGFKMFRTTTLSFGFELNHSVILSKTAKSEKAPGMTCLFVVIYL